MKKIIIHTINTLSASLAGQSVIDTVDTVKK